MADILIATLKTRDEVADQIAAILATRLLPGDIFASCMPGSASYNRNLCLGATCAPLCIMLDDDISGFYQGWDADLVRPLADPDVAIVSARLLRPNGGIGPTCSRCYELQPEEIEVQPAAHCVLPTAAIAFRHVGILFDESFRGSGFEDGDWCLEYRRRYPACKFVQSNRCRLVHANEMKSQREHWQYNRAYLEQKWQRR